MSSSQQREEMIQIFDCFASSKWRGGMCDHICSRCAYAGNRRWVLKKEWQKYANRYPTDFDDFDNC